MDPLGGSFFLETQTSRIEVQAYEYFRRIQELGGVLPAIEKGFFQTEISDAAYRYQREIDEGQRRIVGVGEGGPTPSYAPAVSLVSPRIVDRSVFGRASARPSLRGESR